jgi:hypothetical protein
LPSSSSATSGVAAVAAADDAHPIGGGHALAHRPGHAVEEIGVHGLAPLPIAGVDEPLAEPGRAAEVDPQDRVAAVGQELDQGVVAPGIAGPRAAMDQEHHRRAVLGPAVLIGIGGARQGQVAHQGQAIAGRDLDRVGPRQRQALEGRPGAVQEGAALSGAIPAPEPRRLAIAVVGDDPGAIVMAGRQHRQVALVELGQGRQIGADRRIDPRPCASTA